MGRHKPSLLVGGRSLVARVVTAAEPRPTLVVGLPDDVPDGIRVVREDPPGGGPVAALGAAVDVLLATDPPPATVLVLAADLPFVTSALLDRLASALDRTPEADVAVTTDAEGEPNWLCASWRMPALRAHLDGLGHLAGRSVRALVTGARIVEVPDEAGLAVDVDTPDELAAARSRAEAEGS